MTERTQRTNKNQGALIFHRICFCSSSFSRSRRVTRGPVSGGLQPSGRSSSGMAGVAWKKRPTRFIREEVIAIDIIRISTFRSCIISALFYQQLVNIFNCSSPLPSPTIYECRFHRRRHHPVDSQFLSCCFEYSLFTVRRPKRLTHVSTGRCRIVSSRIISNYCSQWS